MSEATQATQQGTSQVNQTSLTQYDGKPFDITNGAQAGETMLAPSDGSIPPARIAGTARGPGNRYQLDPKNSGNAADYTQGPIIGAEADELEQELAANGGKLPSPIHATARGIAASTAAVVPIPAHLSASFPAGTTVVQNADKTLSAIMPGTTTATESTVHRITTEGVHDIESLAAKVKAFVEGAATKVREVL